MARATQCERIINYIEEKGSITEIWKPIAEYEGLYEISNFGNVKANEKMVNHNSGGKRKLKARAITPFINSRGYCQVNLCKNGKRQPYTVHKLVMLMFVGERPENMEIRHLNSIKTDNRLCNLAYGTHSENMIDTAMINRLGRQRLTIHNVKDIRRKIEAGERVKDIAKEYGVCRRTIGDIKNNHSYAWL